VTIKNWYVFFPPRTTTAPRPSFFMFPFLPLRTPPRPHSPPSSLPSPRTLFLFFSRLVAIPVPRSLRDDQPASLGRALRRASQISRPRHPSPFSLIRIDIRFPSLTGHRRHRLGFERTLVATHGLRRRRPLFIAHEPGRLHRLRSCHHTRHRPPGRQCCPVVCPPAAPASKAVFHGAYREHPRTPVKGADAASGALGPQLQRGQ
jgi:hypothetical protein